MTNDQLSLEEKVDLLLKYQRSARFWGRVRFVINLILFIVLIVLPIVWSIMLIRSFLAGVDMNQLMENIKSLGNLSGSLNNVDIQKLMQ
jgi:hypothetical protein